MHPQFDMLTGKITNLQDAMTELSPFLLGALTIALPVALFLFKLRSALYYAVCEVLFSVCLGLASAVKLNARIDVASSVLAFVAALYVGARGWQNIYDAVKVKKSVKLKAIP